MNTINKIMQKDPLKLADDDHPERKDISQKEFFEAAADMKKKFGTKKKKDRGKVSEFSKAIIEALNDPETTQQ